MPNSTPWIVSIPPKQVEEVDARNAVYYFTITSSEFSEIQSMLNDLPPDESGRTVLTLRLSAPPLAIDYVIRTGERHAWIDASLRVDGALRDSVPPFRDLGGYQTFRFDDKTIMVALGASVE